MKEQLLNGAVAPPGHTVVAIRAIGYDLIVNPDIFEIEKALSPGKERDDFKQLIYNAIHGELGDRRVKMDGQNITVLDFVQTRSYEIAAVVYIADLSAYDYLQLSRQEAA